MIVLPPAPASFDLFVGTYTDAGGGRGIYRARLDTATGAITAPELAAEALSPSYLTLAPDGRTLYAVHESAGTVGAYAVAADRSLRLLRIQSSHGEAPCHLALSSDGTALFVANYGGSLAGFPVQEDGALGAAATVWANAGSGPNLERQRGPHLHSVGVDPTGHFLHACDLGTDEVLTFRLGTPPGTFALASRAKAAGGTGPRHFALSPDGRFLWANTEIVPTLSAFSRDPETGALEMFDSFSTIGKGPAPLRTNTAEIALHPGGRWLYVSNREADTIALFALKGGRPKLVEVFPAAVAEPRGFSISPDGRWLLAAGQRSGTLVSFRIDPDTGRLNPTGHEAKVGKPVCVIFAKSTS